jgi:hypothetical protein
MGDVKNLRIGSCSYIVFCVSSMKVRMVRESSVCTLLTLCRLPRSPLITLPLPPLVLPFIKPHRVQEPSNSSNKSTWLWRLPSSSLRSPSSHSLIGALLLLKRPSAIQLGPSVLSYLSTRLLVKLLGIRSQNHLVKRLRTRIEDLHRALYELLTTPATSSATLRVVVDALLLCLHMLEKEFGEVKEEMSKG